MELICPNSSCPNHQPEAFSGWYDLHGSYESCGRVWQIRTPETLVSIGLVSGPV